MLNSQRFDTLPTWKPIMMGSSAEKMIALQDTEICKRLHVEAVEGDVDPEAFFNRRWAR